MKKQWHAYTHQDYLLGGSTKEALEKREAGGATKCFSFSHQCPQTGTVLSCRHLSGVASEWIDFEKLRLSKIKFITEQLLQRAPQTCSGAMARSCDRYHDIRIIDWLKHARIPTRATNVAYYKLYSLGLCPMPSLCLWPRPYLQTSSYR